MIERSCTVFVLLLIKTFYWKVISYKIILLASLDNLLTHGYVAYKNNFLNEFFTIFTDYVLSTAVTVRAAGHLRFLPLVPYFYVLSVDVRVQVQYAGHLKLTYPY